MHYELVSLQDGLTFYVEHELDAHRNPKGAGSVEERFTSVEKGPSSSKDHQTYVGEGLKELLSADGLALKFPVTFEHNRDKMPITINFKEMVHLPDIVTWWMTTASLNPEFVVTNLPPNMTVDLEAHHPAHDQLKPNGPRSWKFDGVMLPGQGVEFRFKKSRKGAYLISWRRLRRAAMVPLAALWPAGKAHLERTRTGQTHVRRVITAERSCSCNGRQASEAESIGPRSAVKSSLERVKKRRLREKRWKKFAWRYA